MCMDDKGWNALIFAWEVRLYERIGYKSFVEAKITKLQKPYCNQTSTKSNNAKTFEKKLWSWRWLWKLWKEQITVF